MKRLAILAGVLGVFVFGVVGAQAAPVTSSVVYNAIPATLPPNVPSVGFQALSTSEFGDYVHLARGDRALKTVSVVLSDWALYSDYSSDARYSGNSATWTHPITLDVYSGHLGGNGAPDTLLGSVTNTITIPWRPAASAGCGTAWRASDGQCYNGLAFYATFDLGSLGATLPGNVIVGVKYNTQSYGAAPIGQSGPYNSLNVGVSSTPSGASVGSDDNVDQVFWNTSQGAFYTDGGAAGVGIFRRDTAWSPNGTLLMRITASSAISISNIPSNAVYGGSFTPAYTYAGDGVTSTKSNTPSVCKVTGGTVNFTRAGTCTVTAHATATANTLEAKGPQQSFTVAKASTTVSISNIPVTAAVGKSFTANFKYDGAPAGNQGLSLSSSTPATCSVVGTSRKVTFNSVGTCTLTAHADATANYLATDGSAQSFQITN